MSDESPMTEAAEGEAEAAERIAAADDAWAFDVLVAAEAAWDEAVPGWRAVLAAAGEAVTPILRERLAEAGVLAPVEVAVMLSDDAAVRELNRDWRDADKPTNVLSFAAWWDDDCPPPPAPGLPVMLGDVVFARETVVAEAARDGIPAAHHLAHLAIHGLLHLLGYDHQEPDEAEEMETLEIRLLAAQGIADPYADPEARGGRGDG